MPAAESAVEPLARQMPFTARIAATARAWRISSTRCARATGVISASRCRRLAAVTRRYEKVAAELARAGYTLLGEHAFLPRQYFLVFGAKGA